MNAVIFSTTKPRLRAVTWRAVAMFSCVLSATMVVGDDQQWPGSSGSVETLMTTPPLEYAPDFRAEQASPGDEFSTALEVEDRSKIVWWNPETWFSPLEVLPLTIHGFTLVDSFRGPSDGHFQNNDGFKKGANAGGLFPGRLGEMGIGGQLGGSYALYDESGRFSTPNSSAQQQGFVTAGVFRRATEEVPIAFGIVYDGMINEKYGQFAQAPYLSQLRMQVGLCVSDYDEVGFWAAVPLNETTHHVNGVATSWRGVDHYNLFWHHNYQPISADTWSWIGVPGPDRLAGNGSLGDLILGSSGSVAITDMLQLYGVCSYMMPSARSSPAGSMEGSFYVGFGLAGFIGPKARNTSVRGNASMPYLPVADNGSFFVDTNRIE